VCRVKLCILCFSNEQEYTYILIRSHSVAPCNKNLILDINDALLDLTGLLSITTRGRSDIGHFYCTYSCTYISIYSLFPLPFCLYLFPPIFILQLHLYFSYFILLSLLRCAVIVLTTIPEASDHVSRWCVETTPCSQSRNSPHFTNLKLQLH
jgi:hypothetical protein